MEKPADMKWRQTAGYALLILPALALGIWAMARNGVSPSLWGQQIAGWLAFALLALPLQRAAGRIPAAAWGLLLLIPLAGTLLGEEAGGARRWVELSVFHINAAMLVLPALLVVLCRMEHPYPVGLAAAAVLCFQPDLSQLTAFAAAVIPILCRRKMKPLFKAGHMLLLAMLVFRCMNIPTALEPASCSEGILTMLAEASWLLHAAGWAALAAIPAYLMHRFCRQGAAPLLSLSVYYTVSMLFALTGDYPVPFIGFGFSPIAGYWLALILSQAPAQTVKSR